eukprot:TRINITY_DN4823_c0_g1_i10.p1 TRINITY_DN4823_c0_g1~~TRINITY_DN4823_c0_g1_i10.p1  ORF type:complete len:356 (-),score=90.72 TRINITY_DN4823_c0_g1_i10:150-1217(-)
MGNACCKASKEKDSPQTDNAPIESPSTTSPLFENLLPLTKTLPLIREADATREYTWDESTPLPGHKNTFRGTKSNDPACEVLVTKVVISTAFTQAQTIALAKMANFKPRVSDTTGARKTTQLDFALFHKDTLCLISRVNQGPTIPEAIAAAEEKYDEATALEWTADVAEGLEHLHKHGFVQACLDPRALRVTKVSDTCSAVQLPSFNLSSLVNQPCDAPDWAGALAPELLLGETCAPTAASDIWNLGVLLHILLVGEPPLNRDKEESKRIIQMRREEAEGKVNIADFGGWNRVQPETKALVVDMLHLVPEKRLTAEQVHNEIDFLIHRLPFGPGEAESLKFVMFWWQSNGVPAEI